MKTINRILILIVFICWLCSPRIKAQECMDDFMSEANKYIEECSLDTIKAIKYREEYIINSNIFIKNQYYSPFNIQETVTEKQLLDRGYKYRYRWIKNSVALPLLDATLQFEYIFIREPSFKGFIEWWKNKTY